MSAPWRLVAADSGEVVVAALEVADGFWSRFRGLQRRRELPVGAGLLLVPCPSVHTCFMRFAIDVLLLDRSGAVLAVRQAVRPWRVVLSVPGTYAILEVPGGTATVGPSTKLRLEVTELGAEIPPSLAFLHASTIAQPR